MDDFVKLRKKDDPIVRDAEKDIVDQGLSPMAPPDEYAPPTADQAVPYDQMHPVLQAFRDEHEAFTEDLSAFEDAITSMQEQGIDRSVDSALRRFFRAIDEKLFPHNRREERVLFPLLAKRLVEVGEHSKDPTPTTAVDVLEDDHVQIIQLSAVVMNFFGLASRLPDETSQLLVFDAAIEQSKTLVELLRLHMFREDTIVYSLAQKHLRQEELDQMQG